MDFKQLQEIIAEGLGCDLEEVTREADLADDLGADSLDAVELIMAIEDEFEISVDDETAQAFRTVGQIADFIEKELK